MLKMKTTDTVIPTVYRVGQTTLINNAKEEKALPTPPMPTNVEDGKLEAEAEFSSTEELKSHPSSLASSTAGFKLPPLALDPRKDLFCEFWPKVAEELRETQEPREIEEPQLVCQWRGVSQPTPIQPFVSSISAQTSQELIADPFRDPEPKSTGLYSPELSTQALLSRPWSVPNAPEMVQQTMTPVTTHIRSLAALLNGYRSPSPHFTSSLAASVSSLDGTSQNETTPAISSNPEHAVVPLVASFLSDTTVPDGQIFPPGAEFVKSWRMINDGSRDWPESTELHYSAGEDFTFEHSGSLKVKVGKVAAGLEVDVWTGELKVTACLLLI